MAYIAKLYYPEATSGSYELTQPNSATRVVAYQDYLTTAEISVNSQGLSAIGRARFYLREEAEIVVKDSRGVEVARFIEGARAELVDLVNSGFTDGTIDKAFTTALVSAGAPDFKYDPIGGANARLIKEVLAERFISLKDIIGPNGERAVGDGSSDNSLVIQEWIDFLATRGGGVGLLPAGVYAMSNRVSIAAPNITILGRGFGASVLLNTNPGGEGITVDFLGNVNLTLRDFSITHALTSTNAAVVVVNGSYVNCHDMSTAKHHRGFDMSGALGYGRTYRCVVISTDGAAGGEGFSVGRDGVAIDCIASAVLGTGFALRQNYGQCEGCIVPTETEVGYSVEVEDVTVYRSRAENCTVAGFTVGPGCVRSGFVECRGAGNLVDLVTSADARDVTDFGNDFQTVDLGEPGGHWGWQRRAKVLEDHRQTTSVAGVNVTPDPGLAPCQIIVSTLVNPQILTVQATATNGLIDGQEMLLIIQNQNAIYNVPVFFDAQYIGAISGTNLLQNEYQMHVFHWRAADSVWMTLHDDLRLDVGPNW